MATTFFVCSASFLFAAIVFCLQRIFFVCSDHFLFAAIVFCLQRSFFVCSASFLFVCSDRFLFAACPLWAIVFFCAFEKPFFRVSVQMFCHCLQRIFFVCSDRFLFAACPLWAIVFFCAFEKPFFRVSVQMFCHCFTWDHWPTKFLIVRISANHNPELRCVICIGVTRFAPVLQVLRRCYMFCTGVTLELHCSQPIRIE